MLVYAVTIFLSAFLLFQVQPIAAKMILPWFGGGASVWSACLVFFQSALLLGYCYAHWLNEKLRPRTQAMVHTGLLAVSLVALPIGLKPEWKAMGGGQPALQVVALLALAVGLPYLLLSTTGPLVQAWYARRFATGMPYRLYALSNAASMLALLSYPVVVEPNWAVRGQALGWSAGYALFAVMCGVAAWGAARTSGGERREEAAVEDEARPGWLRCGLWIALAACASMLLLTMTRHLTQDVAPVPFLWVLPLSLYLLSFILTFEAPRYYVRWAFLPLLAVALGGVAYILDTGGFGIMTLVASLSGALFVFCMVCHGEMVRRRPGARHLTLFYLMLSVGGALGGMFVGLLAPSIFRAYFEFPIGLGLCAALGMAVLWSDVKTPVRVALVVAVCAYCGWLYEISGYYVDGYRLVVRNFYSQSRVDEWEDEQLGLRRKLLHGRINHGEQVMKGEWRRRPTTYYCEDAGVGKAMRAAHAGGGGKSIGILGLGTGTLAVYGQAGDRLRLYEINPQVLDLARTEFTYLQDTPAKVETVLGDGRLTLEQERGERLDLLALDAFSGDSIPTHLVTMEAIGLYIQRLKEDGLLAVHITNQYLDLKPVMASAAARFGREAVLYEFRPKEEDPVCRGSDWVVMVKPGQRPAGLEGGTVLAQKPGFRPWTDDYSNLFGILK